MPHLHPELLPIHEAVSAIAMETRASLKLHSCIVITIEEDYRVSCVSIATPPSDEAAVAAEQTTDACKASVVALVRIIEDGPATWLDAPSHYASDDDKELD
jgi:hypothetical protein